MEDPIQGGIKDIKLQAGFHESESDSMLKFNRFRKFEDFDFNTNGVGYIFFTKPDLNLTSESENFQNNAFLGSLYSTTFGKRILGSLSTSASEFSSQVPSPFIPMITNFAKGFDAKDVQMQTDDFYENYEGHKIRIARRQTESEAADSFTINYLESEEMWITYLHKAWLDYMDGVATGKLVASGSNIMENILDYPCSAYYFLCGADGFTIKYYAKYTGVFPEVNNYSALSWKDGEKSVPEISINYAYSMKHDLDPQIIDDFNHVAGYTGGGSPLSTRAAPKAPLANFASQVYVDSGRLNFGL